MRNLETPNQGKGNNINTSNMATVGEIENMLAKVNLNKNTRCLEPGVYLGLSTENASDWLNQRLGTTRTALVTAMEKMKDNLKRTTESSETRNTQHPFPDTYRRTYFQTRDDNSDRSDNRTFSQRTYQQHPYGTHREQHFSKMTDLERTCHDRYQNRDGLREEEIVIHMNMNIPCTIAITVSFDM